MISTYKCLDCNCIFEEPRSITEKHGLDSPPYEICSVCPVCLSTDYDDYTDDEEDKIGDG